MEVLPHPVILWFEAEAAEVQLKLETFPLAFQRIWWSVRDSWGSWVGRVGVRGEVAVPSVSYVSLWVVMEAEVVGRPGRHHCSFS